MIKIDYKQAKELCTDTEYRLVEASKNNQVANLDKREASSKAAQARRYYDKWRGQSVQQGRATKKAAAQPGAERTKLKSDIFQEVVRRFEEQVRKLDSRAAAAAKKTEMQRVATERLKTATRRTKKPGTTKGATGRSKQIPAADKSTGAPNKLPSAAATKQTGTGKASGAKKPSTRGKGKAAAPTGTASAKLPTTAQQTRQHTRNSAQRIAVSGLSSRVRGHVSARGKRAQAKRNLR